MVLCNVWDEQKDRLFQRRGNLQVCGENVYVIDQELVEGWLESNTCHHVAALEV